MTTAAKLDPVDLAFENAPEGEPLSVVEAAALEEAEAELAGGAALIPHAEVTKRAREHFAQE